MSKQKILPFVSLHASRIRKEASLVSSWYTLFAAAKSDSSSFHCWTSRSSRTNPHSTPLWWISVPSSQWLSPLSYRNVACFLDFYISLMWMYVFHLPTCFRGKLFVLEWPCNLLKPKLSIAGSTNCDSHAFRFWTFATVWATLLTTCPLSN